MTGKQRAQITMTVDEVGQLLSPVRTATLATLGPSGGPHLVAMWFVVLDGVLWFESKSKAQKVVNLRRDARAGVLVEDGDSYETLRGVSLEGRGAVVEDPEQVWRVGVAVWERYTGPYTEPARPLVEAMLRNRVVVRLDVERTRSWDHRKLAPPSGTAGTGTVGAS